jgi:Putative MetA-pathway of phenol degradation
MWSKTWVQPLLFVLLVLLAPGVSALAQGTTVPKVRDTNVGYIDPAIPGDVLRLRADAAYNNRRPTQGEFFWPPGSPRGEGPPIPERSVDYQDTSAYLEKLLTDSTSLFVEVPVRFLNPDLNANTAGLTDMNVGLKQAFLDTEDFLASFQFRAYAPTGDSDRGLGNDHFSLEPALLAIMPLDDRWGLEGELRYWLPLTSNDFAGDHIRYGLGLRYTLIQNEDFFLAPVAEFVGWTLLDGRASFRQPSGALVIEDLSSETIFNIKLGLRMKFGERFDLYAGYGRPLTGDRWYDHVIRAELRFFY